MGWGALGGGGVIDGTGLPYDSAIPTHPFLVYYFILKYCVWLPGQRRGMCVGACVCFAGSASSHVGGFHHGLGVVLLASGTLWASNLHL